MQAEIIAIGSELTSGARLDTNSQWLSNELCEIGIPVHFHSTMADDRRTMLDVFRLAVDRTDIVLVTGGLGPTQDDLTRELIAELTGEELVLHHPSLDFIAELFAKRGRRMAERNRAQALIPAGSQVLPNPIGTAPGIWTEVAREGRSPCLMAALPGVPSEMKKMFHEQVRPRLPIGNRVIRRLCIHCFGQGESNVEEMLGDLTARDRNPEVGITASKATITLRIAAHGSSIEECDAALDETRRIAHERLGTLIFGEDDDTLESVVVEMLNRQRQTLTSVEAGTRGQLSHMISTASGADACFLGGVVLNGAPTVEIPLSSEEEGEEEPAAAGPSLSLVSAEETMELAQNSRQRFDSDFALAISPFSEPAEPGTPAEAFIALAGEDINEVRRHMILADPEIARPRAAKTALNLLRRQLIGQ